jgi:hypothetical protein
MPLTGRFAAALSRGRGLMGRTVEIGETGEMAERVKHVKQ